MPSKFSQLGKKTKEQLAPQFDEWGGQFSCQTYGCDGYAIVAKYFPKERLLAWQCQHEHISRMENVDE